MAHYVCTRKKVIELFDSFRKRKDDGTASYESTMHNLIYPMGYNSEELDYEDHNFGFWMNVLLFLSLQLLTIVEFKRPKRKTYTDSENPITQALKYAKQIQEGKI